MRGESLPLQLHVVAAYPFCGDTPQRPGWYFTMDILTEICEKRLSDIKAKGFSFGHKIPEKRTRPVVPFLPQPGTILEIKRASPSKGWIAPELDSEKTAKTYIKAGTSAVSCLTEENYFHGSLEDLQKTCRAAGKKTAVLRKDFLLEPEEIEIAYRCGADAVLLIARILETEKLISMAEKAFELGISVLLEVREDSDIEKAFFVLSKAHEKNADDKILLGINSRDLATFTIDLLIPLKLKELISKIYKEKGAALPFPRVISESGVTTPAAADFVGNLGFHGVLIGEAAARNPKEAKKLVSSFKDGALKKQLAYEYAFWKKLAAKLENKSPEKPLVKICGLTDENDAVKAAGLGADLLGFIFAKKSKRNNGTGIESEKKLTAIREKLSSMTAGGEIKSLPLMVGVIVEPASEEGQFACQLCCKGILDGIQFHGCSEFADGATGYSAVPLADANDLEEIKLLNAVGFPRVLIDAKNVSSGNAQGDARYGGTGKTIDEKLVTEAKKIGTLWLSGGITPENVKQLVSDFKPELIDVASGIESEPGKKDLNKMNKLFDELK